MWPFNSSKYRMTELWPLHILHSGCDTTFSCSRTLIWNKTQYYLLIKYSFATAILKEN